MAEVKVVGAANQVETVINHMETGTSTVVTDLIRTVVDTLLMANIAMVSHHHLLRGEDQLGDRMIGQTLDCPPDHHLSSIIITILTAEDQTVAMVTGLAPEISTENVLPEVDLADPMSIPTYLATDQTPAAHQEKTAHVLEMIALVDETTEMIGATTETESEIGWITTIEAEVRGREVEVEVQ
jgi:hypothetical protein